MPMRSTVPKPAVDEVAVLVFFSFIVIVQPILSNTHVEPSANTILIGLAVLFQIALMSKYALVAHRRVGPIVGWLKLWWPVVMGQIGYESLRAFRAQELTITLGIGPKDDLMRRVDELVLGRIAPLYMESITVDWLSHIMWAFYIFIFILGPYAILIYFGWVIKDNNAFYRTRTALVLTYLGGYLLYLLIPVAGPLATAAEQFRMPLVGGFGLKSVFDTGLRYPWDCFPSLHTAIPWVITASAWSRVSLGPKLVILLTSIIVTLSTIYLRYHYGADVVAGLFWAAIVSVVAATISRKELLD